VHLETGADQFRALLHELKAEVSPTSSRHGSDIESAPIIADGQDPVDSFDFGGDNNG
jgi:hypothetical protein